MNMKVQEMYSEICVYHLLDYMIILFMQTISYKSQYFTNITCYTRFIMIQTQGKQLSRKTESL